MKIQELKFNTYAKDVEESMKEMKLNSLANFKCYGYQTVQSRYGIQLMLNIYIDYIGKSYHISHVLGSDKEIDEFFKAIGVSTWYFAKIPSSSGKCIVEKNYDSWIITEWLGKEK